MTIDELKKVYSGIRSEIEKKQKEFAENFKKSDRDIFLELSFCILAAGTSARLALNTVELIRGVLFDADVIQMQRALHASRYRFHNLRADYLVTTREYLKEDCGFQIKKKIESFSDSLALREYFADNKGIKGIGYKEGSHFLRNIGMKGYAILDKHVVNSLYELGAIDDNKRPANRKKYLELEESLKRFSDKIGIDFDELDLLLWYSKTGEIIK